MWFVRPAETNLMDQVEQLVREVDRGDNRASLHRSQRQRCTVQSPGEVVTIADEEAERLLTRRLGELLPGTPVVGEEGSSLDPSAIGTSGQTSRLAGRSPRRNCQLRGRQPGLGCHGGPRRERRHVGIVDLAAGRSSHVHGGGGSRSDSQRNPAPTDMADTSGARDAGCSVDPLSRP